MPTAHSPRNMGGHWGKWPDDGESAEHASCPAEKPENSAAEYFYSATKSGKSAAEFPGSAALSGGSPVVSLDFGLQWPDSPHCSVCTATQTADNRHVAHAPLPVIPRAARLVNLFTAGLLAHPYRNAPSRCPQSPSMGLRMAKPPAEVLARSVARGIPCPVHCSEKRIHSYGYSRSLALRSLLAPAPCPWAGCRRTVVAGTKLTKKRQTPKR